MAEPSPEEHVKLLRGRGGHLPTKASEAARKKKEQQRRNHKQGYEVLE